MPLYRDQDKPYPRHPVFGEMQDFFRTNPPTWVGDPEAEVKYQQIYGASALHRAVNLRLLAENVDKNFVYGTNWQGKVYVDNPDADLPAPPWERPDFTGLSRGEEMILRAVYHLIDLLKKE